MAIRVECACGKQLSLKDELAGKKVRCPECKAVLQVPAAAAEPGVETAKAKVRPPPDESAGVETPRRPVRREDDEPPVERTPAANGKAKPKSARSGLARNIEHLITLAVLFIFLGVAVVAVGFALKLGRQGEQYCVI